MDNRGFAPTGTAPTARSGPRRRVQRRKRDSNGFSPTPSEAISWSGIGLSSVRLKPLRLS